MAKRNYNLIVNTLGQNSFIMYNRIVARRCGVNAAVLLGDLISSGLYWENTEKLADDGFFFKTREDIQNSWTHSCRLISYSTILNNSKILPNCPLRLKSINVSIDWSVINGK